jgi:hypothetical protein
MKLIQLFNRSSLRSIVFLRANELTSQPGNKVQMLIFHGRPQGSIAFACRLAIINFHREHHRFAC